MSKTVSDLIPSICEVHSALIDNASISLPIKLLPQCEIKVSDFSMVNGHTLILLGDVSRKTD